MNPGRVELHAETLTSEGSGEEEFLLIHGYGASIFSWRYWAPGLARRGRVTMVDLKGCGSSPSPDDGAYAPGDHAELVVDLIVRRDLRNVTLVGHSLGGGVALLAALRLREDDPGRLGRLILVASAAYPQRLPPFAWFAKRPLLARTLLKIVSTRMLVRGVLRSVVYDAQVVNRDWVAGYTQSLTAPGADRALIDTARQLVPRDLETLTRRYGEIDAPTLILWGRQDRVVPLWVGERLQATLQHAHLEVFEACGHLPQEELPRASLAAVEAFLDHRAPGRETFATTP